MSKTTKLIIGVIVVVAVIWVGYTIYKNQSQPVSTEPIKIGFIGPLTGDAASYGTDEKNATSLAVDEINQAGGVNGRKLEVIYEDGKCTGQDAATAAQKLINIDKVKIILGGICSGETLAIAPIAQQDKVITISAFSSSPNLTNAGSYIFRIAPSDLEVAKSYVKVIVSETGYKKVAILSENTDYAMAARTVFNDETKNLGGTIVADETFKQGERDFRANITKIKSSGADAIFINAQSGVSSGLAIKQLKELGVKIPIFGNYTLNDENAKTVAGQALNGVIFFDLNGLTPDKGPIFLNKFNARFGKVQGNEIDAGARYDSVYMIANALKECSLDTTCMASYLHNMDWYDGTIGRYKFDPKTSDSIGIEPLVPKIFNNGQVELYKI